MFFAPVTPAQKGPSNLFIFFIRGWIYLQGSRGNFEKSGFRFSMKACFPSLASSLR
jgi:hypothetical protein